jgi:Zn-dependent protease
MLVYYLDMETIVVGIIILVLSVILHEVAHGYVADWLGDPTARYSGRLTLNPIPHIDPVGSIFLPGILALTGSPFMIGWAKPVPYNPYNLRNQRWGEALVAASGPLTNIALALLGGLVVRMGIGGGVAEIASTLILTNLVLAIYNLIPIPPLDGSKVLASILPHPLSVMYRQFENTMYALGPFGLLGVGLVAIYLLWPVLSGIVISLFMFIVGAGG